MRNPSQTTLADYLRTLWRYRLFIVLAVIVCAAAGFAYSKLQTPSYDATATESVRDPAQDLSLISSFGGTNQTPLQIASAHLPQVTRTAVVRQARAKLGTHASVDEIRSLVSVSVDPNSFAVHIKASSSDPVFATRVVNAFAQADARLSATQARKAYADAAARLQARIVRLKTAKSLAAQGVYTERLSSLQALSSVATPVKVTDIAQVPGSPSSPNTILNTLGAAGLGLLLGIALAYGRGMLDRRLRDPSDVEQVYGLPIAAHLRPEALGHTGSPRDAEIRGGTLEPIDAESFRRLRENVRYLAVDQDLRTIAVTSAIPEEGKSTVAACLATASAAAGAQTLLVECDLRKRVLAGRMGLAEAPGLSDFLAGRASPQDILQLVAAPAVGANGASQGSLVCISAGSGPPRPADLLSSQRFADFLASVRKVYDQVIIDCPPLLAVADTLEIVPHVDGMLICVRLNRATVDQAEAAREALDRLPSRPAGLVITDFTKEATDAYRDYYYYREELATPAGDGLVDSRPTVATGSGPT